MALLANGFPRLNMCASAIFVVGTSGIPPKLNYRSVKSYTIYQNIYVCIYIHIYIHICMFAWIYIYIIAYIYIYIYTQLCKYLSTQTYICTQIHTHTHTHTRVYIYIQTRSSSQSKKTIGWKIVLISKSNCHWILTFIEITFLSNKFLYEKAIIEITYERKRFFKKDCSQFHKIFFMHEIYITSPTISINFKILWQSR